MLKIKEDLDLKELEKYGFEKRYDEKNGELKYYKFGAIFIEIKNRIIPFRKLYKNGFEAEYEYMQKREILCLYNLIKADLIEKVEEK